MKIAAALLAGALCAPAFADVTILVAIEPTARVDGLRVTKSALEASLGKPLGQPVTVTTTEDLTDALRSTRSNGYDVFIGPAQVAASAIAHGYELVGSTDAEDQYVLVGRADAGEVSSLRRRRLYLPQQDSIYTYLARGLLTAGGLSFKDLLKVEFARYPQAGLTAIGLRMTEATVVRIDDWEAWNKSHPGTTKVLATSGTVPGGFSVAVRKDLPAATRKLLATWFETSATAGGMKRVAEHSDLSHYRRVAELGSFTPTSWPGVTVVGAAEVRALLAQGVRIFDTRNEKEYNQRHIPQAAFLPYHEKSLKDVAYDAKLDEFPGLKGLDPKAPTIFHCNGPECWKSYKASRAALAAGFTKVYWYRGGMPDWIANGLPVASQE